MLVGSDGVLRKCVFLWKIPSFSQNLCSQGCRNGGENGAIVFGGSRDLGRETGQNARWCRVVMRGAKKGVFQRGCGGGDAV